VVGDGLHPADAVGDAEILGPVPDPGQLGLALAPGGAADDHQRGVLALDAAQHLHRHAEALERLHPAHEEQDGLVAEAQRTAGAALVARREEGVVDTRGDDLDAVGGGVVEHRQLALLGGTGGTDDVRAADDRALRLGPALRLGVAVLGLDPGQGVEGRHQRQGQAVLQFVAGQT
jgi:hypothetical protein